MYGTWLKAVVGGGGCWWREGFLGNTTEPPRLQTRFGRSSREGMVELQRITRSSEFTVLVMSASARIEILVIDILT